jgi:hypothetical protein
MTHKKKDCMERPRTKGAKFTGAQIAADEKIQELELDFDGKRDRWNGYATCDCVHAARMGSMRLIGLLTLCVSKCGGCTDTERGHGEAHRYDPAEYSRVMDRYEKVEKLKEDLQKEKVGCRAHAPSQPPRNAQTSQWPPRDASTVSITCMGARADFAFPYTWAAA